jgi:SH3-like domain-containing protein
MAKGMAIRGRVVFGRRVKGALWAFLAALIAGGMVSGSAASAADEDVPFWGSIRAEVVNARVGPSTEYPIIWIYKRRLLPLKVIRVHGPWWQIEDPDGAQSWIFARLLSSSRTALVAGSIANMHEQPDSGSRILWRLEPGVVGRLGECKDGWCPFDVNGRSGYVAASSLWGSGRP